MSTINLNGQEITLDEDAIKALVNSLPVDQLLSLKDTASAAQADLIDQLRKDMAPMLEGPVQQLLDGGYVRGSKTSAWVGASVSAIEVEVMDGENVRTLSVSVRVTDKKATEERESLFPKKAKATK